MNLNVRLFPAISTFTRKPYPFSSRYTNYTQNFASSFHIHDYAHIWYCRKGEYLHCIDGVALLYGEGSMLIVPPGTSHEFRIFDKTELISLSGTLDFYKLLPEKSRIKAMHFLFSGRLCDTATPKATFLLEGSERNDAEKIFDSLCKLYAEMSISSKDKCLSKLDSFFSLPCFELDKNTFNAASALYSNRLIHINNALKYIEKNFTHEIFLKDVLKQSAMSRSTFYRDFPTYTGTNFSTYTNTLRLHLAKDLIQFSNYTLDYIANACGFCNTQYMFKLFKAFFGYNMYPERLKRRALLKEYPEHLLPEEYAKHILSETSNEPSINI